MRIDPVTNRHAADDRAEIEITRRHRRRPKTCFALSIPITSAASETSSMNGHMIRVSEIVSAVLSGDQLPHVNRSTSCGAKTMPSSVTTLMNTAVSVATLFASRHADSIAVGCDLFRERRDERCRKRALGKQIAQQIRQPKRHQKRVQISARSEEAGEHLFANQSEHAAAQNRDADNTGRAGAYSPVISRSHRRMLTTNTHE